MKKLFLMAALAFSTIVSNAQYHIGDKVADFSLVNVDGKKVALADYPKAKGFIVVFTCNTCPYAVKYLDRVKALNSMYASSGYPVIAINPNDPEAQPDDAPAKIISYAKAHSVEYPYLYDPGQVITKQFGAQRTPQIFIVQKTNNGLQVAYIGAIDNDTENKNPDKKNYAQEAVNSLLKGQQPEIKETKAIGCTVKSKA